MSFTVLKNVKFSDILQEIPQNEYYDSEVPLQGGILSDFHVWHVKGPSLEVRNTKSGLKVGGWTFGCILRDSITEIVCVEELKSNGGLSLLVVALNCNIKGGIICLFNIFRSKVIRTIELKEKISSLCIIDPGLEVLNLPGPLRDFDGILAVGTEGGKVLLIDICRQICEQSISSSTLRDELNPSQLVIVVPRKISKLELYRKKAIEDGDHLAIFLNVVVDSQTQHFTLKGPKGEDRIHVNCEEVATSALYYCNQLTSLLIGFNFGAFQLWNLTSLELVYTSHVCDEHIPITKFALQEPTDDPKAFCYIWVAYSNTKLYQTGLPFAVMYSFCYDSKEYHDGYGYLYEKFQSCSVRFQVELGPLDERFGSPKGGYCLGLQPVYKQPTTKDSNQLLITGDTLALCVVSWSVWQSKNNIQNYSFIFDLNQWYKEQMPNFTKWGNSGNFILKLNLSDLVSSPNHCLSCLLDPLSLRQFVAVQRLEEHFYPTSLTFDMWLLRENDVVLLHNEGLQKFLLNQIQTAGSLCLIKPNDICHKIFSLGLTPLFVDVASNNYSSIDFQREVIFNVALEHHLISWLYNCATGWANGGFSSTGCSLDFLLNWAFQRAIVLKTNCDKYCAPLFDYSQSRLDHNTSILLNSCTGQINILCKFYFYVITNLSEYVSSIDVAAEQRDSLEMVAIYFEVLQWLVNVGLLPESHPSSYPRPDISERISAPYPIQELTEYYVKKRAQLQLLSKERFASSDSLLFIDNLITHKCGAELLQKQWQEDEGTGLYPPPSLQSLLRTYLVPGTNICHKHSLVIYLFLDLAMMLDQSQYSPVITYLIKFPAVFKVTSSIIKITQAFWQLDHGDYNTAIEQLLDPFVLNEDLQPWHHTIAMRSLLLQNQHNAALLYMEVRKPPILDDNDILTALSLYITNNMLSEAFYFLKGRCQDKEEKYLIHLFKECDKNELLHGLLYRCLNTSEEKAFLKYLSTAQNPTANDLEIFYFLLRSRFLEAFDMHTNLRKKKPECQGLIGQRNATQTDQIVKIFKTLLPDVNRNLVEYIRKERSNLWKAVPKPTPLSVFVHNTREQVHYKSTVIHAAISKAKNTFVDSMNVTKLNDIETEDTPFLRTPTAFKLQARHRTPIITPKVIEVDENGEELSPSPPKRIKLSPRAATTSPSFKSVTSLHSKMLTPVIKRKTSLTQDYVTKRSNLSVCTPQSILKVRSFMMSNNNPMDDTFNSEVRSSPFGNLSFGLQPRRSLSRATQHVQFKDAGFLSSSLSDQSTRPTDNSYLDEQLQTQSLSSREISLMVSSKESSSHDDVFYSPDTSTNDSKTQDVSKENDQEEQLIQKKESEDDIEMEDVSKMTITEEEHVVLSPRARKSYKRPYSEIMPTRSSPRLSRKIIPEEPLQKLLDTENNSNKNYKGTEEKLSRKIKSEEPPPKLLNTENNSNKNGNDMEEIKNKLNPSSDQSPRILQKLKSRRPLSRQVLEHNTFSKMYQSSPSDNTISKEISLKQSEKLVVSERSSNRSNITSINSSLNITDTSTTGSPVNEKQHTASSSFSKSRISEITIGSETSTLSDYSFRSDSIPDIKIPDVLLEYLQKASNSHVGERNIEETTDILPPTSPEKGVDDDEDPSERKEVEENTSDKIIIEANMAEKKKSDEEGRTQKEEDILPPDPNLNEDEEDEPSDEKNLPEVYEDLSSGSEDIAEVLNAAKRMDTSYTAERKGSSVTNSRRETYFIPEADVAFLADESKTDLSVEKSVIVISSDDESSSKISASLNSNSNNSLSGNESDDLNVSYEHNIHIEENSRSLIDSEYSRTTEVSSGSDLAGIEQMEDDIELQQPEELDINEDNDPADWMNDESRSSASDVEAVVEEELEEVEIVQDELEVEVVQDELEEGVVQEEEEDIGVVQEEEEEVVQEEEEEVEVVQEELEVTEVMPDNMQEEFVQSEEVVQIVEDEENDELIIAEHADQELAEDNVPSEVKIIDIQNDKVELIQEQTYLDLQSHSSFFMEPPNYLQGIPLEDNELFEGTLIKELSTGQGNSNSEMNYEQIPIHVESGKREIDVQPKDETMTDDKGKETHTPLGLVTSDKLEFDTQLPEKIITEDKENEEVKKLVIDQEKSKNSSSFKDQSTNTTFVTFTDDKITENKNDNLKETFVSNIEKPEQNVNVVADTEEIKEELVIDINKDNDILKDKFVSNVKKLEEDPNTSSSDTTEGGGLLQEITVTAQIHTPSKEIQESISQDVKISKPENVIEDKSNKIPKKTMSIDLSPTTQPRDTLLPGVRTRRSLSFSSAPSETKSIATRNSTRSEIVEKIDCNPSGSKETVDNPTVETLMRGTRGNSIDNVKTYARKRSLRSSSVDEQDSHTEISQIRQVKPRSRALSISNLPIVKEEENKPKGRRRAASTLEDYASSRRLTRRQAGMLKGISTPTGVTVEDDSDMEVRTEKDDFDPIQLLDKKPFEGKPDPEEKKVYEESSPSTSTVSSFVKPSRRLSRSASATSDTSLPPSASQSSPIRKSTRKTKTEQETSKGVKTRSRKQSDASSVVSEKSDSSTPPKRTRSKRGKSAEADSPVSITSRTTRSRASSTKSESPKSKTTARRRIVSTKSDLPEIMEEKTTEAAQIKENKSRKRKKSH